MESDHELAGEITEFCSHVAGPCEISAVCICGDGVLGTSAQKALIQILMVVRGYQPRLMSYVKFLKGKSVFLIVVDQWVFERDVDRGFLGEALASSLIFPYTPLVNGDYLYLQEVKLKKRLILEVLENLVLDFPRLSCDFRIRPVYFVLETLWTRVRLFPPMLASMPRFVTLLGDDGGKQVLRGFDEALEMLETDGVVCSANGYLRIARSFVDSVKTRRMRFLNLFRAGQRTLFASILGFFPKILDTLSQSPESLLDFQKILEQNSRFRTQFADPENYVYVPTASGLVPLASRMDIAEFSRKVLSADRDARVEVEQVGGILNDVYLIKVHSKSGVKKAVVKRFREWSSFKWFPLTLWSVGTRTFAVSGKSRLERECSMNQLLCSNGLPVPRILYASAGERLIFMQYIEGEPLDKIVRRIMTVEDGAVAQELGVMKRTGELFAAVHALNVTLGDTKPENIMVTEGGEVYLMDFEQAVQDGDKSWDLAEFLYYMGHDVPPLSDVGRVELVARTFLSSYLGAGGDLKAVKNAGAAKYTKVFSVFTLPHMMYALSNICRKADDLRE